MVTGGVRGVALVAGGELLGVYSETDRQPVASPERLAELLRDPRARVTLRQSPEERQINHFPETAYHAFVEDATEAPAPLSEALAAITSYARHATSADIAIDPTGPAAATQEPELTAEEPELTAEETGVAVEEAEAAAQEPEFAAEEPELTAEGPQFAAQEPELTAEEPELSSEEPELSAEEPRFAEEPEAAEAAAGAAQPPPAPLVVPPKLVMPADLMVSAQVRAPADPVAAQPATHPHPLLGRDGSCGVARRSDLGSSRALF